MKRSRDMQAFTIGKVYGECEIIENAGNSVVMKCSCGNVFKRSRSNVRSCITCRECKINNQTKYIVGAVVNKCTIIEVITIGRSWRLQCHCGQEFTVKSSLLAIHSCGCLFSEKLIARAQARVGSKIGPFTLLSFEGFLKLNVNRPLYTYQCAWGLRVSTLQSIQTAAKYHENKRLK